MNRVVVVVAPHPDDEVLGCGATIARHKAAGDKVLVVIATNAYYGAPELYSRRDVSRVRKEAKEAHRILGVHETIFMDFPAPALNAFPMYKISNAFQEIFNSYKPSILYLPFSGDLHFDHKVVYSAALVAGRPQGENRIANIYCYETLSETEWAPRQGNNVFSPNHFVDVTDFLDKKINAFKCYKSQIKIFPHLRSVEALTALASYRGSTAGLSKAEAFEVERQIL
jgi:N-acetylglucosamine malate deacetylase 1